MSELVIKNRSISVAVVFVVLLALSAGPTSALLSVLSPLKKSFKMDDGTSNLGKKSTALDVLNKLNKSSRLATYVTDTSNGKKPLAIVTGGSSGIGIPSVEALSLSGMKVVLCARNVTAAKDVVKNEIPSSLRSNIRIQELDLSDMNSIANAAKDIIENDCGGDCSCEVDVILNNAGVMAPPKRVSTAQDLELQFGTNHVGHHMLTRLLLPYMRSDGRIVTVASTAHEFGKLEFDNLNYDEGKTNNNSRKYSSWGAYGQSKLANVLFAKGLDDKLKASGSKIKSVSLHPGVIGTNLWRYSPKFTRPFLNAIVADKNVQQGAATNVYSCLVEDAEFKGGEYLKDCAIAEPSSRGKDTSGELRSKLWDATEAIIVENGFELPKDICK